MNTYNSLIFEEKVNYTFSPSPLSGIDSEWIEKVSLFNFGISGEILSINVSAKGAAAGGHGIQRFAFWIANYDFSPLITSPSRTLYSMNKGPFSQDIVISSGDVLVGSTPALDGYNPIYSTIFKSPVPYINNSTPLQLAFTAEGIATSTIISFTIRGRRVQWVTFHLIHLLQHLFQLK